MQRKWTPAQARRWYADCPLLVGANYTPASASNQLEMWQAETFDPVRIDQELQWAEDLGMNTMRVFLHDLLWEQDPEGFKARIDTFLSICQKHNIKPMFVLFDSCWDPNPKLGKQEDPVPGVHNSRWVQSPGMQALKDPEHYPRLERYVKGVVGAFKDDPRILAWDVWNEPDNINHGSYKDPEEKWQYVERLLPKAFKWAREAGVTQPLTSGIWNEGKNAGRWASHEGLNKVERIQIENSDIISFHNYECADKFGEKIDWLSRYGRPIICTEFMAREHQSTFQGSLPVAMSKQAGSYCWGFVDGRTQTREPWTSWGSNIMMGQTSTSLPANDTGAPTGKKWFHEIFHADGTPYDHEEIAVIKGITQDQPKWHELEQKKESAALQRSWVARHARGGEAQQAVGI